MMGGLKGPVKINSLELASRLDTSPQTAARRLQELEEENLITRTHIPSGQYIFITDQGKKILRQEYNDYRMLFEDMPESIVLKGRLIEGLGEGKYYVTRDGYRKQFKTKLGFDPFPGTLNLKLDMEYIPLRGRLEERQGIKIDGFTTENRTFGDCKCFRCSVDGKEGAVVIPSRTHYPSEIIEIISPVHLRKELGIEEGDEVTVEVIL
jgi:riboflavin kinase